MNKETQKQQKLEQRDRDRDIDREIERDTETETETEREMEDTDLKTPILGASQNGRGGGRLSRRTYSVKSLRKSSC